ncbi:MAG: Uma2 family endonuclease, partial [Micromonosporaceae bacterium]
VWEGVYHMTPGPNNAHGFVEDELTVLLLPYARAAGLFSSGQFNLGEPDDYRVPDGGYHRERLAGARVRTAAIVVVIVSPGDETYEKFGFYAAHGVDELLVADPDARTVLMWKLTVGKYQATSSSSLLNVSAAVLTDAIDWP